MGLLEIKKELKNLDKDKIIDLMADLYKKNKSVKEYLDFFVNPNEKKLFENYRDKIYEAFYPKLGYNYKLKDGKKAIGDFKKLGASANLLADLMLFYVETGVKFTNEFGDINDAFYNSLETTFNDSLILMRKENQLDKFEYRIEKVIDKTINIGWGFHDHLVQIWGNFYPKKD